MTRNDVGIAVVGGGIGGLTLGLALRQHGLPAQVFERAPELTEVGAAVALAANGTRILRELGLSDQLAAVSTVPSELVYRHWSDGRRLVAHPVGDWYRDRFGAPFWGIHRAHLQRALAEAWGSAGLHLGKELAGLRERAGGIELSFADGSTIQAGLVVGADGVNSRARRAISDTTPAYSGTSGFRGLVPRDALPGLPDPDAVQFWMGPGAHLLHYAVGDVINFLAVVEGPAEWPGPTGTAPAEPGELAAHFAGWHPAVLEMIHAVPQSPRWGLYTLPPLRRWSRGRIVLLGDAAHAMLPHHGQGANQTLEDAAVLADCLAAYGSEEPAASFAHYEQARRARARQVQRSSWVTSALLHLPDGPAATARDNDLKQLVNRFSWIHQYDHRSQAHSVGA